MDNDDKELNRLLDAYRVEDASDALAERIVQQAARAQIIVLPQRKNNALWRNASLMAATALLGFWLGNAMPAPTGIYAAGSTELINYDTVILGPQDMQEIML